MTEVSSVVAGYLLGSIPFAYIIARARGGFDIRTVDIGNAGAGSVMRAVGPIEGLLTLVGDVGKGCAAILLAQFLGVELYWVMAAGAAAVLGHVFPVFIGFKGGQGVATSMGVFGILTIDAMVMTLMVMGVMLLLNIRRGLSRRLFLISACGAPLLPAFVYATERSVEITVYAVGVVLFIASRNLKRLRHPRTITERLLKNREARA